MNVNVQIQKVSKQSQAKSRQANLISGAGESTFWMFVFRLLTPSFEHG
jgi:hypothetical protein